MRMLSTITLLLFISINGFSQQVPDLGVKPGSLHHAAAPGAFHLSPASQSVNSFYIDYDSADAFVFGSANYMRYIWPMNTHYTSSDSSIRYCVVAFDSLFDSMNQVSYSSDSVGNLAVDSIFLSLGHENNSGVDDTLLVKLVAVDTLHGYPQLSSIYWSNMVVIPAGSPLSGDWKTPVTLRMAPYASIPYSGFALLVEYMGSVQDTLGIVAGFGFRDTCGQLNQPADTTHFASIRKQSSGDRFMANSFAMWSQYQSIGMLPTPNGSNIYYDCNGNNQYDGGSDGESYIQNIHFRAHVKTNAAGLHEYEPGTITLGQNVPNPFRNCTQFSYSLENTEQVTLEICDLSGKNIFHRDLGRQAAGKHNCSLYDLALEPGFYLYSLSTSTGRITRRMLVIP